MKQCLLKQYRKVERGAVHIVILPRGGGNYKIVVFLEKFFDDINVISWTLPYIAEGSSLQASNNSMWLGTPQKS